MSFDRTISQGEPERRRSQEMSLQRGRPPAQVPGYALERFLGDGAYGEVWVGVEQNTGRRVAVKFYAHRGGLDWSLLSREVEKLALLFADRYVVQLIRVGWDAEPPYYIMEYLEQGSLADRLHEGPLSARDAIEIFRGVAVGLVHAHGKGVLHCDLKPANVLLDQDGKPRLADFGQSRLSHEQIPALGTLFYMAPEQADLQAAPDARWDVYALGALLYCMLTGRPPYRSEEISRTLEQAADLEQRLSAYRRAIRRSPLLTAHRQVRGVDRALAEIIERCLDPEPANRYPNVQSVLDALNARDARRAMRPAMVLGVVGPLLLLAVVAVFAGQGFSTALHRSEDALTQRALLNNRLSAEYVAGLASKELHRRFEAVEQLAQSPAFLDAVNEAFAKPDVQKHLISLTRLKPDAKEFAAAQEQFRKDPDRAKLHKTFESLIPQWMSPPRKEDTEAGDEVCGWFFYDAAGVAVLCSPESERLGRNFARRTFFHGGPRDLPRDRRPLPDERIKATHLSAVFHGEGDEGRVVAVSTPVIDPKTKRFLGVVALTVRVTRFVELQGDPSQFPVLVDLRDGDNYGMILQHPLLDALRPEPPASDSPDAWKEYREHLSRLQSRRLSGDRVPNTPERGERYRDPFAEDPAGDDYRRPWLAQSAEVAVRHRPMRWVVISQESYDTAMGGALRELRQSLINYGMAAMGMVLVVLLALWTLATRLVRETTPLRAIAPPSIPSERSSSVASSHDFAEPSSHEEPPSQSPNASSEGP